MHSVPIGTCVLFSAMVLGACSARAQSPPLRRAIDTHLEAAWQREKVVPADPADDAAFLRRIYLDLVGTVPGYAETKRFLDDPDPKKRAHLIDRLLEDPRFAAAQAQVWDLVLFGRNPPNQDATRKRDGFRKWLAGQFARNVPYDQWVRRLLLAEEEGSETFLVQFRNQPEEATVAVSRIFLGTQLQCARCHDHPYESWKQKDFYGMAGFFVRLTIVDGGGSGGSRRFRVAEKSTGEVLFSGSVKEQRPGRKGDPVPAKFLGGTVLAEPPVPKGFKEPAFKGNQVPPRPLFSRKQKLAEWLTTAENPYFARALANRLWAQFLGRGLVHPVDDLSENNPPKMPELLEALTHHLIATKFDLKDAIRELTSSKAYQLAGSGPVTEALPEWFERARVRPLSAEELLAAFQSATDFPADGFKGSGAPTEYMIRYFGTPTDGQGNFQGSIAEHLFLNNSGQMRALTQPRKGNLADTLVKMKAPTEEKVDRLFLSVLSRPPRPEERQRFVRHLDEADSREMPRRVEEAVWVLLSCSEFRFNH